jgi:SAM-dependent methyltransferase
MNSYNRKTCILCQSSGLELVLSLTPTPIADHFVTPERLSNAQECYPLDLNLCRACGNVQLSEVVDPEVLFGNYIYLTSFSLGLSEHFQRQAREISERVHLKSSDLVVDIGSNNGALLLAFQQLGVRILGVDPAREIAKRATEAGIETIPEFFSLRLAESIASERGRARVITANNVFAHSDALGDMTDGIRELLSNDGVFIFEVNYLTSILQNMLWDTVYHEHLCYHSVAPLRSFFRRHGLHLFDIQKIGTKGGSLRGFVQHQNGPFQESSTVEECIAEESLLGLSTPSVFDNLARRILQVREDVRAYLENAKKTGRSIVGFGSSATSTTLLYHFGLHEFLDALLDDNVSRHGLFSPGIHLPVYSPERLYGEDRPDAVLILAWRFVEPIRKKHERYLLEGGEFIIPLPQLSILSGRS